MFQDSYKEQVERQDLLGENKLKKASNVAKPFWSMIFDRFLN